MVFGLLVFGGLIICLLLAFLIGKKVFNFWHAKKIRLLEQIQFLKLEIEDDQNLKKLAKNMIYIEKQNNKKLACEQKKLLKGMLK